MRLGIEYRDKYIEVVGLVNTGYEGDVPEILIPIKTAERLGVWPNLPEETLIETYKSASGLMQVYRIRGARVYLVGRDIKPVKVDSYLVVSEYTDEVLINDQLISSLGIVIEDPAKGLWRIRGETRIRESESYS